MRLDERKEQGRSSIDKARGFVPLSWEGDGAERSPVVTLYRI